jgi:hypothetical protein
MTLHGAARRPRGPAGRLVFAHPDTDLEAVARLLHRLID